MDMFLFLLFFNIYIYTFLVYITITNVVRLTNCHHYFQIQIHQTNYPHLQYLSHYQRH